MKSRFDALLEFIGLAVMAVILGLCLSSCTTTADVATSLSQPIDSALVAKARTDAARLAVERLSTGRIKFKGPVTLQIGGAGNTGTSTDATKAKAPVAAGPHAVATDSSKQSGTPWYVFAGLGLGALAAGYLLRGKLKLPFNFGA